MIVTSRARHCLVCGHGLRSVRHEGRPRRGCPACAWIFYDNPVPAVGAIITRGDRILLARRAAAPYAGTWDVAGGFLEAGETPEQALRRELREELGAQPRAARLVGFVTERYGRGGFPVLAIIYAVRLAGTPRAGSDVSEVRWFARERLPFSAIGFPAVRRALRAYVGGSRGRRR